MIPLIICGEAAAAALPFCRSFSCRGKTDSEGNVVTGGGRRPLPQGRINISCFDAARMI